ncbi:ABC transporter substrate-binding protein [Pengzhenrongella phosphoraccumulans]|uniref:peptide ABC transporter substrate-binding protein n=1 Tax=Pengzhenrongella phosphoraccumulans TaxID=3114394 RepID=UPI00388D383E
MKFRRIAGLVASVTVSALALTACSGAAADNGSGDTSGVVLASGSEPQHPLVPTATNETGGGRVVDLLFAGLIRYDAKGAPHNEVAQSIETTDAQTYTITLKPDWTFTNGDPITATSFVDAWNYGALLSNAQLSSYFFESIEGFSYDADSVLTGLTVVDDATFTVKLKQPEADFPLRLGYPAFAPLPQVAYDDMAAFGENPIGNGPYKFAKDGAWEHNVGIDLVPNTDYLGERVVENAGVRFTFYGTPDSAYNDLLAGQLDVLDSLPDSAFGTFESELGDRAVNQPAAIFMSIVIPQYLEHFSGDEGILRRQAISFAINRPEITDAIFQGTRTPASDFSSPVVPGWSDSIVGAEVLTFDEKKAQALWAQADKMSPFTGSFTIGYNSDGGHATWVDAVTNGLRNTLGIEAEGHPFPTFAEMRDVVDAGTITGAFSGGWQADYPSLYNFLGPLYATDAGSNDGRYSNPAFDALLTQGSAATSVDEANTFFDQAQEILLQDLPAIPLWYTNVVGGSSTEVSNVEFGWNSVPLLYQVTKN